MLRDNDPEIGYILCDWTDWGTKEEVKIRNLERRKEESEYRKKERAEKIAFRKEFEEMEAKMLEMFLDAKEHRLNNQKLV
jgi:hypothetical protein